MSAMHHQHVDMGAVMEERDGWQMPARFGTVEEELRCLRSDAGLLDISPMTKLNIQGEHAAAFMSAACSDRQWLELAHRRLDEAVFAAYGWSPDLTDGEILAKLLELNLSREPA